MQHVTTLFLLVMTVVLASTSASSSNNADTTNDDGGFIGVDSDNNLCLNPPASGRVLMDSVDCASLQGRTNSYTTSCRSSTMPCRCSTKLTCAVANTLCQAGIVEPLSV
eukprot:m.355420 g.355420  ORF g.355420 m.355420 type:complete len:109 (+) comp19923_c0_seq12:289-615(+)